MHLAQWKRWQWIAVGLCCGAILAYFYGQPSTPSNARRMTVEAFQSSLNDGTLSHITVYPPHEGIYLVTGLLTFDDVNGPTTGRRYVLAKTPFDSDAGKFETVLAYLEKIKTKAKSRRKVDGFYYFNYD